MARAIETMKYVIVSGGVVSGLGKGITISSLGRLLQGCGLKVTAIKIDPYLNVDAGTYWFRIPATEDIVFQVGSYL